MELKKLNTMHCHCNEQTWNNVPLLMLSTGKKY